MKIQFALKMGFLLTLACACKKESLPPIVLPEPFFFYATTFDSGGNPLISDWNFFNDYSLMGPPYDTLVPSTCPDNGGWALNIQAQRNGTSFAEKYFTHLPGNKRIKLTFFAALYFGQNATSFVLRQIRNGSEVKSA